jgi:hypothetical protein
MSRSKKWKLEWSFFLDSDGRRKYNDLCRRCTSPCKQSFRVEIVACPFYKSKRIDRVENMS